MFKVNTRSTRCCSSVFTVNFKYIWHVVLVHFFLHFLLTLIILYIVDGILYCLNLNLSVLFRVRYRSPATYKKELYMTTVNSSSQSLPIYFFRKSSTWSSATLGKFEKLTLLDALNIHFRRFFALCFLHLISSGLNGVNINSLT